LTIAIPTNPEPLRARARRFARPFGVLVFAGLAVSARVGAAGSSSAREYFELGVRAVNRGDLSAAVVHFEQAYALTPSQRTLYNLGQTYAAAGRPLDATRVLRRYLAEDAPPSDAERRKEVETLLQANEALIGTLTVALEPSDASAMVDGVPYEPSTGPLSLLPGQHLVTATREGFRATFSMVNVTAGSAAAAQLVLESAAPPGHVRASCPVPEVQLSVDDQAMGMVPGVLLSVCASGEHSLRFERPGYRSSPILVNVQGATGAIENVACRLELDPEFPTAQRSRLELVPRDPSTNLKQADVRVDGASWQRDWLPPGKHQVDITLAGFHPWRQLVDLAPGSTTVTSVVLEATATHQAAERAKRRRTWAYVTGGAGLAAAGSAIALYFVNQGHYSDWRRAQLAAAGADEHPTVAEAAELGHQAATVERYDNATIGLGVVAGALLTTSTVLFLLSAPEAAEKKSYATRVPTSLVSW